MKDMDDTVEISGEGAAKAADDLKNEDTKVDGTSESEATEQVEVHSDFDTVQKELAETKNRLLRQAAEFQNYKRRTEQEKGNYMKSGKEQVIRPMLDIFDDFTRSIDATKLAEEQDENLNPMYLKLREGVELVYDKFRNELNRLGVEPIEAVGKAFNENEHEALMQQPAPEEVEPGTILEEIQTGYRMGDKILRHSRVIVAS